MQHGLPVAVAQDGARDDSALGCAVSAQIQARLTRLAVQAHVGLQAQSLEHNSELAIQRLAAVMVGNAARPFADEHLYTASVQLGGGQRVSLRC